MESQRIFMLSALFRDLLTVASERRLALISLQRFRQWNRYFLAIYFDSDMPAGKVVVDVEIFRLCYRLRLFGLFWRSLGLSARRGTALNRSLRRGWCITHECPFGFVRGEAGS